MTEEQRQQLFTLKRGHYLEGFFMTKEQNLQLFTFKREHCLESS